MLQRRNFLATTGATVGFLGLQKYLRAEPTERVVSKYGDLIPDPEGILDLPKGFSYQIISRAGEIMSDGLIVPGKPDGMACFTGRKGSIILVRNHELGLGEQEMGPFPNQTIPKNFEKEKPYDFGNQKDLPHIGGTSNIVYDPQSGPVAKEA